ncbi:4-hydroxy-3-methylbut-2-enyl diphosphate reductase [Microvirga guangxiensis]|uniref:4-hydroxy-3-methylbut-2-enyl diphosphate reductase n=1 Tax=Microvirga guangxiensis TaxID=549386 RepID=A0A1G5EEH4_9HYPH|nr:4-hydroxy-3-methylbut-2-enyl diphosphate reductase [Microvirga guangxiensis]SCY25389.1 4-hydroxy-3-methylbut-2-enyl diphosphate reductase [Microvirga guangxiensis]
MIQDRPPLTVLLAAPRGFCAGVERAIRAVEDALQRTDRPVYVRHEIVHNGRVVNELKRQGAVFVEDVSEIPDGAVAIFSAHGVSRSVEREARSRKLAVLDATCPLVRRVHLEGQRHAKAGREVIVIGHRGHVEIEGTIGQIDGIVHIIDSVEEALSLNVSDPERIAYITQTTLSVDDTREIIAALKRRFPAILGPDIKTICYATQNRQLAVRVIAERAERIIVCGARNSSNTNRLYEVAESEGRPALLMQDPKDLTLSFIDGAAVIGITAGASAPEELVQEALALLAQWRRITVEEVRVTHEGTQFAPVDISQLIAQLANAS